MANPTTSKPFSRDINPSIAPLSIGQAVQAMHYLYSAQRNQDDPDVKFPLGMLGPPGQGKSAAATQFAKELREREELLASQNPGYIPKKVETWSLRLNQCDPTDIKGIPLYAENLETGSKTCKFAIPELMPVQGDPTSGRGVGLLVLFLDDFRQATPVLQQLAANLIDGIVGDYRIDFNRCFIILAANRQEDNACTFETPNNIQTRVTWVNVNSTFQDWEIWGTTQRAKPINPFVMGYLKANQALAFNEPVPKVAAPYGVPRTWEKLSDLIDQHGVEWVRDKSGVPLALVNGTIGKLGTSFYTWLLKTIQQVDFDSIFSKGTHPPISSMSVDQKYSVITALAYKINELFLKAANNMKAEYPTARTFIAGDVNNPYNITRWMPKEDINTINNIFKWVTNLPNGDLDVSMRVLLMTYQTLEVKTINRTCFMKDECFSSIKGEINLLMGLISGSNTQKSTFLRSEPDTKQKV